MTSWTIFDSQITPVREFDLAWLPHQSATYITPHIIKSGVALEAASYVGALPLLNGDTLYIAPRIGQHTLSHMLMITGRLENTVQREFEQFTNLSHSEDDAISWINLLSRSFLDRLRFIEKSSLRSERTTVVERRNSAKGQLAVVPTLVSLICRDSLPVHCTFRARTYDTSEHRVLAAAAEILLSLGAVNEVDRITALGWARRLEGRPLTNQELRDTVRGMNAGHYTGPRAYYIKALVMAQLILLQGGLSLDEENTVEADSLLTNVYTLFERYVRITLRNHLTQKGYVVEKLETGGPTLFADGTAELKPDVVISDRKGVRLLVDAKYKIRDGIQASDYYQMATYLKGYQVKHGVIVRPGTTANSSFISRRMNYGGTIYELNIGLNDPTLADTTLIENVTQALADATEAADA